MSGVYPELDLLSPAELEAAFRGSSTEDPYLWYDEVAIEIRKRDPGAGASFLRGEVAGADPVRLVAILLAITWFGERDRSNADLLIERLEHPDEGVVARAIDSLAQLGGCGLTERILALGADPRELVRGAVLRFASEVVPDRAPSLLLAALTDPHYIGRANAISELEDLGYTAALVRIEALCADPAPLVRQVALSAIANLGGRERAVPFLLDALRDPHHLVRENSVRELAELECTAALPHIKALSADPDPDVRFEALSAIPKLGGPDKAITY